MYPWLAHLGSTALDKCENAALTAFGIYAMSEGKKALAFLKNRLRLTRTVTFHVKKTANSSRAAFEFKKNLTQFHVELGSPLCYT
jgi:hypothetical protein